SLYEFVDIRTILLNAMSAKSKDSLKDKQFSEKERIANSPILFNFAEHEDRRVFRIIDDTPVYTAEDGEDKVKWFLYDKKDEKDGSIDDGDEEYRDDYIERTEDKKVPPSFESLRAIYNNTDKDNYIGDLASGGLKLIAANLKVIGGDFRLMNLDGAKAVEISFPKTTPSSNPTPQV
ncbi:hypothetical protein KC669_03355, partial [Candidatus Dojkabacteria bacterium]|nr:hypothetical protein [Candidatus Dojkabacteria bacterium]